MYYPMKITICLVGSIQLKSRRKRSWDLKKAKKQEAYWHINFNETIKAIPAFSKLSVPDGLAAECETKL